MYKNMKAAKIGIWKAKKMGPPGKLGKHKQINRKTDETKTKYFYINGDGVMLMIG
jgi:hypothetical protein